MNYDKIQAIMAKAINWPAEFRDEILAEDTESIFCAFRLGTLYYEGGYWTPGEEVDIRCNHLKIRRAVVEGDLQRCRVGDLSPDLLARQKGRLQSIPAVIAFLTETYDRPVDENTELTVVCYRNLPVVPENVESEPDPTGRHF